MVRGFGCIAALLFCSTSTLAMAQEGSFSRQRNVSVRERPRPDFEALGSHLGGFILFPKIVGEVLYDDNIFALPTGTESDTVFRVRPSVTLSSEWSRHSLEANASLLRREYVDFSSENATTYSVGAGGRLDIERFSSVTVNVNHERQIEERTAIEAAGSSAKPIRYNVDQISVAGQKQFNRLRLNATYDLTSYNYKDALTVGGLPIDQDFRDDDVTTASLRVDYAISPDTFLFVRGSWNQHEFDVDGLIDRDSDGYELTAGADFDLTNLMRGQIEVGILRQNFDAAQFGKFSGAQVRGRVEYFPTQLTTITLNASRNVQDSGIPGAAGYLSTATGLQIDHELMRNVILTARGDYEHAKYRGINRSDDRYNVSLGGTYLLNRNVGLSVTYNYLDQRSDGLSGGFDFSDNRLMGTVTLQY